MSDSARALLDAGTGRQHAGYQLYASVRGVPAIEVAGGEAAPGRAMTPDSLTLWFSAGKPIVPVAVLQLWQSGRLSLDDRVADHVPEFGTDGKESATIRHLLTHRGGFPFADDSLHPDDWPALVATVCAAPAQWAPGTAAGYHGTSAWVVLAELVARIDGRPFEVYARDEIFGPAGMTDTHLRIPEESVGELRPRLALIQDDAVASGEGGYALPFRQFDEAPYLHRMSPGNTARGPARDLGRLYEHLLDSGGALLGPTAAEAMLACHRLGFVDTTYQMNGVAPHPVWGLAHPWALGLSMAANGDVGSRTSARVVASSGAFSSIGFADPETGLVCVVVTTGLLPLAANEQRLAAVCNAVHDDLGL
jgi:CubicO group peptidase (beta-lactamase class C family)